MRNWYYFSGWMPTGRQGGFARKYSRGPMLLTADAAVEEFLDTAEVFQRGMAMMHRWDPSLGWQLIR